MGGFNKEGGFYLLLTGNKTKTVAVPHEEGEWFEFNRLSWRVLEKAQKIRSDDSFSLANKLGMELFVELGKLRQAKDDDTVEESDPLLGYDHLTLLVHGIKAWSYGSAVPSEESIDELDPTTKEWAVKEIYKLSIGEKSEEERKNG